MFRTHGEVTRHRFNAPHQPNRPRFVRSSTLRTTYRNRSSFGEIQTENHNSVFTRPWLRSKKQFHFLIENIRNSTSVFRRQRVVARIPELFARQRFDIVQSTFHNEKKIRHLVKFAGSQNRRKMVKFDCYYNNYEQYSSNVFKREVYTEDRTKTRF